MTHCTRHSWVWWTVLVLWIAVGATVQPVPAQDQEGTATLTGVVEDGESGSPLPLANVVVAGTRYGATTDEDGQFTIENVPAGTYTVVASYVGFETRQRELELRGGEVREVVIELTPRDLEVEGVTVTGERIEERQLGTTRISPAEVKNLPSILQPDLFRSLQLLPGVKAASDFSSGLYVRGGSPDQTLVLLDEAPLYNPTHVFGFFSTFNPDAIGDVVLFKGGYPVTYGGRLGAVVDIETKRPQQDEVTGGAGLGLLSSGAYAQGAFDVREGDGGEMTWLVAARRSTIEPLLSGLSSAGVEDIPTDFYFYDVNTAFTFDLNERNRFGVTFYAGRDQLNYPFLDDAIFDVSYGNRAVTYSWRHLASESLTLRVAGAYSHYFADPTATLAGTEFVRDNDVYDARATGSLVWQPGDAHTLSAGGTVGHYLTRSLNFFDGDRNYSPRIATWQGSAYVQDAYAPPWADDLELTGGLRLSYYEAGSHLRLAPRIRTTYQLTDAVRLQAGYGRYYQYLTAVSNELFSAFDFWLTTDERVPPSYGDQFLAGVKTTPFGRDVLGGRLESLSVDLELYYRTMRDLFEFDRLRSDYAGFDYNQVFLFGEGNAYGAELTVRKREGRVNGFVGYSLSRTEREFDVLSEDPFPPKYDRTHDVTAVLNYDLAEDWRLTSVFTYATGQAYTEPNGYYRVEGAPWSSADLTAFQSDYNGARLPAYHRLDVGLRKKGDFFGIADYEAQVQVVNLYGRRNVWFVLFEPTSQTDISRNVVPQIPVPIPNLSLTLTF
jgi:hypothetical protein